MKWKNLFAVLVIYALTINASFATKLPPSIVQYIKSEIPNANVRFDALVSCPNGTLYLPVFPSDTNRATTAKVVETYPAKQRLSNYPEVLLFENNYALLKIIKKNGKLTVTDSKNIPFIVKTGVLPQDLLVPPGLVLPDDLKIILGDLKIHLVNSPVNNFFAEDTKTNKVKKEYPKFTPNLVLKNKTLLATTLDSKNINVIRSDSVEPKYVLKLESLPKFIQPVSGDRYLLVGTSNKTFIDVADVEQEVLAKKIDLAAYPSEILISKDKNIAYVTSSNTEAIYLIDLKTMNLTEKIKIKGYPKNITLDASGKFIAYIDKTSGDVYTLELSEPYLNKFIANTTNISKIISQNDKIYLLSRTTNKLLVMDSIIQDIIYDQEVAPKPIDMFVLANKLYILCASNKIQIFDLIDYKLEKTIDIPSKGFSNKFVQIPNSKMYLVTNISDKKYYVFDTETNNVVQTIPTDIHINDLKIINKQI